MVSLLTSSNLFTASVLPTPTPSTPSPMVSDTTSMRSSNRPFDHTSVESAIDAYASRILEQKSPPGVYVDSSLGPYVTAILRSSDNHPDVTQLVDFESLVELLQEHCSISRQDAEASLRTIATAVKTQSIPEERRPFLQQGSTGSTSTSSHHGLSPVLLEPADTDFQTTEDNFPPLQKEELQEDCPDSLIPGDLLGLLDQREAAPPKQQPCKPNKPPTHKRGKGKKNKKVHSDDLAAALFRPARSLSNADEEEHKQLQPPAMQPAHDPYFHQQWDTAVEILLSINSGLSEEAAAEAALLANTDVNVAQYVIDQAMAAPPICRHLLNDGCYRSDCHYSHDIEGHTCLFWMRGRCGKGQSCRFFHGFSRALLEGIHQDCLAPTNTVSSSVPIPQSTTTTTFPPFPEANPFLQNARSNTYPQMTPAAAFGTHSLPTDGMEYLGSSLESFSSEIKALSSSNETTPPSSFANIASKGYNDKSSFYPASHNRRLPQTTVRIPQDVWNPHENRDSSAFFIPDPLERYYTVAQHGKGRPDVIDLHYQSTKTFAVVLSTILPEKLAVHPQVWLVTGSGHHVGNKTHQKSGGALETAVLNWLLDEGYDVCRGKDRNGHGGAVLVKR